MSSGQSAITITPFTAPPSNSATVPPVPLMRAVRPNSVTATTVVSAQAGLQFLERPVDASEAIEEGAAVGAFAGVGVPSVESHGGGARPVGAGEEARRPGGGPAHAGGRVHAATHINLIALAANG